MQLNLSIEGKIEKVEAQIINGTLWLHHKGRTLTTEASAGKKSRRKGGGKGSSDQIISPMPGKITKLFLKVGDKVEAGQAALVMEAMKMEYTLKAEISGVIESLQCSVGEQVVLGKALVKIIPASDK